MLDVDLDRERISLSLKATQEDPWQRFARTHVPGQIVKGKVTKIVQFGVFISVEEASKASCTSPSWPTATWRTRRPSSSRAKKSSSR